MSEPLQDTNWQVFICYRQIDGAESALWLYQHLDGVTVKETLRESTQRPKISAYFDQATPAISNWRELHQPALEASRALLLVCTPGLASRLNEQDWVHLEIDWWLEHRETAPILIDATGEGARWIPEKLKRRWPQAQWIQLKLRELERLDEVQRTARSELIIERIIGGIISSEAQTRFEDLEKQRVLVKKLRRNFRFVAATLLAMVITAGAAVWFAKMSNDRQRETNNILAMTLIRQAEDAWVQGDDQTAKVLSARALSYGDSPELHDRYMGLTYWINGDFKRARDHLSRIMDVTYKRLIEISQLPHRVERYARLAETRRALNNCLALTARLHENAYEDVLRFKGLISRIEEETRRRHRATNLPGRTLVDSLKQEEAALVCAMYNSQLNDQLTLAQNVAKLSARLCVHLSKNVSQEFHDPAFSWRQIQRELRRDEALVDYLYYRDRYVAWVLTREGEPVRVELGPAALIEQEVEKFLSWAREKVKNSSDSRGAEPIGSIDQNIMLNKAPGHFGSKLRSLIWDPVEVHLGSGINTIYLSPDGALATIPFGALPGKFDGTILWEEHVLSWLASAHDLLRARSSATGRGTLLVAADKSRAPLPVIPGTKLEVESIAKLLEGFGDPEIIQLVGSNATELNVRKMAPGRRILHFASHGWADYSFSRNLKAPLNIDSKAAVRYVEDISVEDISDSHDSLMLRRRDVDAYLVSLDPALRAGLGLYTSDMKNGMDDGVLTAMEVASLDLDGVELVVLSGCDTAGKAREGIGLIGLISAFREAGAKSVLASLYIVPDKPDLMTNFYRYATQSRFDYPLSLRKAALEMRAQGMGPFYWAPFVAYGAVR